MSELIIPEGTTHLDRRQWDPRGYTSVVTPDSLVEIPTHFFHSLSRLQSVTIGKSVTKIAENAFYYCLGLRSVHIRDLASWCAINFENMYSNPIGYGKHLFLNGEEIIDLIVPDSVKEISKMAFWECDLKSVTTGSSLTRIGELAFADIWKLEQVVIGESVVNVGDEAFKGSSVRRVTFLNPETELGKGVFNKCENLSMIIVPNGSYKHYSKMIKGKAHSKIVEAPVGNTEG